jgi:hypothetical protein
VQWQAFPLANVVWCLVHLTQFAVMREWSVLAYAVPILGAAEPASVLWFAMVGLWVVSCSPYGLCHRCRLKELTWQCGVAGQMCYMSDNGRLEGLGGIDHRVVIGASL